MFYDDLKRLAANDNRSVSQEVLHILREYLAKCTTAQHAKTPAQVLLELAGSWQDVRSAPTIVRALRQARKRSFKLRGGW